jgi:hypothetical protein
MKFVRIQDMLVMLPDLHGQLSLLPRAFLTRE